jgi:NADP-dependent 3-hydroxy acid dehydrogenase YdfG
MPGGAQVMKRVLDDEILTITGAASGIGRETASSDADAGVDGGRTG